MIRTSAGIELCCKLCSALFDSKTSLTAHVVVSHMHWFRFKCSFCTDVYLPTEDAVTKHFDSAHNGKDSQVTYFCEAKKVKELDALLESACFISQMLNNSENGHSEVQPSSKADTPIVESSADAAKKPGTTIAREGPRVQEKIDRAHQDEILDMKPCLLSVGRSPVVKLEPARDFSEFCRKRRSNSRAQVRSAVKRRRSAGQTNRFKVRVNRNTDQTDQATTGVGSPMTPVASVQAYSLNRSLPALVRHPSTPSAALAIQSITEGDLSSTTRKRRSCASEKVMCPWTNCDKSYSRPYHLKRHSLHHTGERKPYGCTWPGCSRFCQDKDALRRHTMRHTNERPFKCERCARGFRTKYWLQQHDFKCVKKCSSV